MTVSFLLLNFALELQLIFICGKNTLPFHLASEVSAEGAIYWVSWGLSCFPWGEKQTLDRTWRREDIISLITTMTSSNNTYLNGYSVNLACPVCLLGYQVVEHILLTSSKRVFPHLWNYYTHKKKAAWHKKDILVLHIHLLAISWEILVFQLLSVRQSLA